MSERASDDRTSRTTDADSTDNEAAGRSVPANRWLAVAGPLLFAVVTAPAACILATFAVGLFFPTREEGPRVVVDASWRLYAGTLIVSVAVAAYVAAVVVYRSSGRRIAAFLWTVAAFWAMSPIVLDLWRRIYIGKF